MFMMAISCHGTENDELLFSDDTSHKTSRLVNIIFSWSLIQYYIIIFTVILKSKNLFEKNFRATIFDLIHPVLNCSNLAGVTKVFVLNHCRGFQNFQLAQKVYIEGSNSLIGSEVNSGHLLDDCLFYYSTAHGNPAVRNTNGSVYFKAYFKINVYNNSILQLYSIFQFFSRFDSEYRSTICFL